MSSTRCLAAAMLGAVLACSTPAGAHEFFTVSPSDAFFRHVRAYFGWTTTRMLPMVLAGDTVVAAHGMTLDVATGETFIVLETVGHGPSDNILVTLDNYTGDVSFVAALGDRFGNLAPDASGRLWAVTRHDATTPAALYELDKTTGAKTFRTFLTAGDSGHALDWNENTGLLYHATGTAMRTLETINPDTLAITNIPLVGGPWGTPSVLYYDEITLNFLLAGPAFIYDVTVGGSINPYFQSFDHTVSGIAGYECYSSFCGDCNENGTGPDILDALTAAQIAAGVIFPSSVQNLCCDVNANARVEILDALIIAQEAAGLPISLMCFA